MDYRAAGGNGADKKRTKKEVLEEKKKDRVDKTSRRNVTGTISYISLRRRAERRTTLFRSLVYVRVARTLVGISLYEVPVQDERERFSIGERFEEGIFPIELTRGSD